MQRHQARLGAIAHQQENERQVQRIRITLRSHAPQCRPGQPTFRIQQCLRGGIKQDGTKQRQRNAKATEHEEFPCRFHRRRRAMHRHHQHSGEGCDFNRHPKHAKIIRQQREVLRAEKHLKSAVIGTDAPVIELLCRQRGRRENGGGQSHKRR